jgi:hypothetical protein
MNRRSSAHAYQDYSHHAAGPVQYSPQYPYAEGDYIGGYGGYGHHGFGGGFGGHGGGHGR